MLTGSVQYVARAPMLPISVSRRPVLVPETVKARWRRRRRRVASRLDRFSFLPFRGLKEAARRGRWVWSRPQPEPEAPKPCVVEIAVVLGQCWCCRAVWSPWAWTPGDPVATTTMLWAAAVPQPPRVGPVRPERTIMEASSTGPERDGHGTRWDDREGARHGGPVK